MRVPPEELRAAASDLLQLSGEVSHVQSAVRHHWGRLDAGWQSYARAGVDAQYEETVREIDRMAVMLEQLGAALVKTADIIETADRDAPAFFAVEEVKPGSGKALGLAKGVPDGVPPVGPIASYEPEISATTPLNGTTTVETHSYIVPPAPRIRPGDLPIAEAQLALARIENVQLIQQLVREKRWRELAEFTTFMQSIHPGSVGLFKWSGRFMSPGDVGHAVLGIGEGVFIGTAGAGDEYGVYIESAAEYYTKEYLYIHQLTIYEVQDINDEQRQRAADYAMEQYGTGYSYAGVLTGHGEDETDDKWYCSELVMAALEQGDVTFYRGNGNESYKKVFYPTFPHLIAGYYTQVNDGNSSPTGLTQTWPPLEMSNPSLPSESEAESESEAQPVPAHPMPTPTPDHPEPA